MSEYNYLQLWALSERSSSISLALCFSAQVCICPTAFSFSRQGVKTWSRLGQESFDLLAAISWCPQKLLSPVVSPATPVPKSRTWKLWLSKVPVVTVGLKHSPTCVWAQWAAWLTEVTCSYSGQQLHVTFRKICEPLRTEAEPQETSNIVASIIILHTIKHFMYIQY